MRIRHFVLFGSLAISAFGCSAETQAPGEGEEVADSQSQELLADQSTYYSVRPDYRKCVYPLCGGLWVSRVNRPNTRCADGSRASECYVADADLSSLGLPETQEADVESSLRAGRLILRGNIARKKYPGFGALGHFEVSEAWEPATSAEPSGKFYRVTDSGIRCITYPCPSFHEAKLNRRAEQALASIDLTQVGASDEAINDAYEATTSADGILIAGTHYKETGPAGTLPGLEAAQFYRKVTPRAEAKCQVTGCSGQLCADQPIFTTCEWREEYACYDTATCERQKDGSCGWTQTPELDACLNGTGL